MGEEEARRLERTLWESFSDLAENFPDAKANHFSCFRGDSWQFVVYNAAAAPSAAVYFRASLLTRSHSEFGRRRNSSVAIGFGSLDFVPGGGYTAGGGEAYMLSGRTLDKIRTRMPGMSASGLGSHDLAIRALLGLVDAIIRGWTPLQAKAVGLALRGLTQEEIATQWEPRAVSQQAIHKHLQSAGWPALEPALQWLYTTTEGCYAGNNHRE